MWVAHELLKASWRLILFWIQYPLGQSHTVGRRDSSYQWDCQKPQHRWWACGASRDTLCKGKQVSKRRPWARRATPRRIYARSEVASIAVWAHCSQQPCRLRWKRYQVAALLRYCICPLMRLTERVCFGHGPSVSEQDLHCRSSCLSWMTSRAGKMESMVRPLLVMFATCCMLVEANGQKSQ